MVAQKLLGDYVLAIAYNNRLATLLNHKTPCEMLYHKSSTDETIRFFWMSRLC